MARAHPDRIHLFLPPEWRKISVIAEETGLPYEPQSRQFRYPMSSCPRFLALSPYGKIPAILDPDGPGGKPLPCLNPARI